MKVDRYRPFEVKTLYFRESKFPRIHNLDQFRHPCMAHFCIIELLRIPAIHGAKTTKNQTPLARLA